MDGRLWATAKDGPGTIFHFALPKYHEEGLHAGLRQPDTVIAVVDDDPSVRGDGVNMMLGSLEAGLAFSKRKCGGGPCDVE